jgi:hypothetical protein
MSKDGHIQQELVFKPRYLAKFHLLVFLFPIGLLAGMFFLWRTLAIGRIFPYGLLALIFVGISLSIPMMAHSNQEKESRKSLTRLVASSGAVVNRLIRWVSVTSRKLLTPVILFALILLLGIFARVWRFGQLPPGLNQDEASIGVEAYDLVHFGVDRNGISFPVNFISWGNGMDALYGYILMPFMLFGLTPLLVRLPVLISGILTLPLVFFIGKRTLGRNFGLLAMFLLAISPWHILMSRWGINENILPFVFCLGVTCLLLSTRTNRWFIGAAFFLGLCLYAYGAAYVAVPIFLACTIPILLVAKRVRKGTVFIGMAVFTALAVPILLFILVNMLGWNTLRIGIFSIPHLPVTARFLGMAAVSHANQVGTVLNNLRDLMKLLLLYQSDGTIWNAVEPFGYMYPFSISLAVIGAVLLIPSSRMNQTPEKLVLLAWLAASLFIGLVQMANINRIQLVFIPLILCIAVFMSWLGKQNRLALAALLMVYLVSFYTFINVYQGDAYQKDANQAFFAGLIPALDQARLEGNQPICVTDQVNMPYIYVLFTEKMDPAIFLKEVKFIDPDKNVGNVYSLGRYTFGIENCSVNPSTVYVLSSEKPPDNGILYSVKDYIDYHVFSPTNTSH